MELTNIKTNIKKQYFNNLLKSQVDVEIITKHEYKSESIATASGLYNFILNDKKIEARFSFVFLKTKEKWEILSHHSSVLPESKFLSSVSLRFIPLNFARLESPGNSEVGPSKCMFSSR